MKKSERISKRCEFQRVLRKGVRVSDWLLAVYMYPNGTGARRAGFSLAKGIGGAVERNRVKRLLRAAYDDLKSHLKHGVDLVVLAKAGLKGKKYRDVRDSLERLMRRVGVLND